MVEEKRQNTELAMSMQVSTGGLQLRSLADMKLVAETLVTSGLIPPHFNTAAKVIYALQCGYDLGLKITQALQELCVVNGKIGMSAKCAAGLIRQRGNCTKFVIIYEGKEYDDNYKAVVIAKRNESPDELRTEFSVKDAKTAGLWGKGGAWTTYPKDMLTNRAISRMSRYYFSDVTCGLYTTEELADIEAPAAQATAAVPSREERKTIDSEVVSTQTATKEEFDKFVKAFADYLTTHHAVQYQLDDESHMAELFPIIAKFCTVVLKHENAPTIEEIGILTDYLTNCGLPNIVVDMLPDPFVDELGKKDKPQPEPPKKAKKEKVKND